MSSHKLFRKLTFGFCINQTRHLMIYGLRWYLFIKIVAHQHRSKWLFFVTASKGDQLKLI